MLKETFVASVLDPKSASTAPAAKDSGIFFFDVHHPQLAQAALKRSSTQFSCLAVSDSHVYAAQADKAAVHVYAISDPQKWYQEATVPFNEKITCLALLGPRAEPHVLALGTEGGRTILWELRTGRQVSTSQAHLQQLSSLTADAASNFLLTGATDSLVHVWSIPALLSFTTTASADFGETARDVPHRSFSGHRGPITSLVTGQSSSSLNIAVSASRDKTCMIWNYQSGELLHTFLLPSVPLCLALDPAERSAYAGLEDGRVQLIDFFKSGTSLGVLHSSDQSLRASEPSPSDCRVVDGSDGSAILCMDLTHDGATLLLGCASGRIHARDTGSWSSAPTLHELGSAVTNLVIRPLTGLKVLDQSSAKTVNIQKPKFDVALAMGSSQHRYDDFVPPSYEVFSKFTRQIPTLHQREQVPKSTDSSSDFDAALEHSSFPLELLEEGLTAMVQTSHGQLWQLAGSENNPLHEENVRLREQLATAKLLQRQWITNANDLSEELTRMKAQTDEKRQRAVEADQIKPLDRAKPRTKRAKT